VLSLTTNNFSEEQLRVDRVAGAVDGVNIGGAASGGAAYVAAGGADAAVPLLLAGQGSGAVRLGVAGAAGGPTVFLGTQADQSYVLTTPASGFAYTVPNNCLEVVLHPSGGLASGSLTMPGSPLDGQSVTVSTTQTISALNVLAASGQAVNAGNALTLAANSSATWKWIASLSTWIRK